MDTSHAFVRGLLVQAPELQPLFNEHIEDNDELLPHVFMGDVTRFVVALSANSSSDDISSLASRQTLIKILDFLEEGMQAGDDNVRELISASFLENLDQSDENYQSLKSHFGRSLLEQLRRM